MGPTPMRRDCFSTGIIPISERKQCPKTCTFIQPGTAPRLRQAASRSKRIKLLMPEDWEDFLKSRTAFAKEWDKYTGLW
jgi:hypothetical protein